MLEPQKGDLFLTIAHGDKCNDPSHHTQGGSIAESRANKVYRATTISMSYVKAVPLDNPQYSHAIMKCQIKRIL